MFGDKAIKAILKLEEGKFELPVLLDNENIVEIVYSPWFENRFALRSNL